MSHRLRTFTLALLVLFAVVSALGADPLIRLESVTFDPLAKGAAVSAMAAAPDSPYGIVQCKGPIQAKWRKAIEETGTAVLGYLPDYAYLVRAAAGSQQAVRGLPFVRWVGPYLPDYKLSPYLAYAPINRLAPVTVLLHKGEQIAAVRSAITTLGARILGESADPGAPVLRVEAMSAVLPRIARISAVRWIEPYAERQLFNDVARGITGVNDAWTDLGLYGAGQIVAVCDTGLDTGDESTLSADFAGRIAAAHALAKLDWSDTNGHGTHTSGTVLGSGILSGSGPSAQDYQTSFAGVAPEAQLVMQAVMDDYGYLSGIPMDLNDLFQQAYDDGARVHSDSWGSNVAGRYTIDSVNVDKFLWDHKDMVIVFAAGNAGIDGNSDGKIDPDSMGAPATAKNCISVGATENFRLSGGYQFTYGQAWRTDYPVPPISTDKMSNNADGMAAFSSRGPCDDGRIKPDVCAPGTNIISCRSHASGAGDGWGAFDDNYVYMGGTSMACPHAAGAAAIVREYFQTEMDSPTVSAAMVKAVLINGAKDLTPGQYGTGSKQEVVRRPDNSQGWGLIDLANALEAPSPGSLQFVDDNEGLVTDDQITYPYAANEGDTLRFTLAYTDYPAEPGSGTKLVNDLDLSVTTPGGHTIWPNGRAAADHLNPVEDVSIPGAQTETGTYTVTIRGTNVPFGDFQPYAFVARIKAGFPDLSQSTKTASPIGGCPPGGTLTYTITVKNIGSPAADTTVLDPIPANTTYVPGSTTLNGVPVQDVAGRSPLETGMLVNTPGFDPGVVRRVGPAVVTFQVMVDAGAAPGARMVNTATISCDGGISVEKTVTNRVPRPIRVKPGGTGDGSSWENAMGSVAKALVDTVPKDQIWVAAGTYTGLITVPEGVKIYGGFAGNETESDQRNPSVNISVLDGKAKGSVVTFLPGATADTVIDGLTIKNGKGTLVRLGKQTYYCGGGVFSVDASPTISNNRITGNNVRNLGAGIYYSGGSPMIVGNKITGNIARYSGFTGYGGGIYCATSGAVISRNLISANKANHGGGGICCAASTTPTIINNTFVENGAMKGGAVFCDENARPTVASNLMIGNKATMGGCVFCGRNARAVIVNNTMVRNAASPGGGISVYSAAPTIANNIIAFNSSGISRVGSALPTLKNNCIYRNLAADYTNLSPGAGDISADPRFMSFDGGDYHLSAASTCLDSGDDSVVQGGWLDIDAQARIIGAHVDIGADER